MMEPGLAQISPELVDLLRRSSEIERNETVGRACELAVRRSGIDDPKAAEALEAIRQGGSPASSLRTQVDILTEELDEVAWDIQDQVELGAAEEAEYLQAFAKARAVASLGFALERSLAASFDALYEAYCSINDHDEFMQTAVR